MEKQSFVIERIYEAPVSSVWKAITQVEFLRQWYFEIPEFKPEVGFEFSFISNGPCEYARVHLCKVTEVIKEKRLAYSWRYEGFEGCSLVSFELQPQGGRTRLLLKHEGLETFPASLVRDKNFPSGWTWLIDTSLANFLEGSQNYQASFTAEVTATEAFDGINRVAEWWTNSLEGSSAAIGDEFTVRFGDTFVTMKIVEFIPEKKVVWLVTDCCLHWLQEKEEWLATRMVFEVIPGNGAITVRMTHEGLVPQVECYENCEKGWDFYVKNSLRRLLTEKKGAPDRRMAESQTATNS